MRSVRFPHLRVNSRAALALAVGFVVVTAVDADETPHGSCAGCHLSPDPSVVSAPAPRPTCTGCHEALLESARDAVSGHLVPRSRAGAPLEGLPCVACHAAHPEGRPAQLRGDLNGPGRLNRGVPDATTRLCLACHLGAADTRPYAEHFMKHPVGTPLARDMRPECAPVALKLEVVRMDDGDPVPVIACTTCHVVHSGPNPDLLLWAPDEEREACGACHVEAGPPMCDATIAENRHP